MKNSKFYFVVFSIFILILSNQAMATTITVDGAPDAGWGNADVAKNQDAAGDPGSGGDNFDILTNYITDDGANLYVRFDITGTVLGDGAWNECFVFIDTDNNPATGHDGSDWGLVGADYRIIAGGSGGNIWDKKIQAWNGSGWTTTPTDFQSGKTTNNLEIGVALAAIGSPSGIMKFSFVTAGARSDYNNDISATAILYTKSGFSGKSIDGVLGDWDGLEFIASDDDENDLVCIPDTVNFRQVGITSDAENIYIRMNLNTYALWRASSDAYKEYRIWIDTEPETTQGYRPYIDTPGCESNPACIHWENFYADYHITISTYGTADETINQKMFLDCGEYDCADTADFIILPTPPGGDKFDAANGWMYIEFKIPRANVPDFDPECFEMAFTTYDTGALNAGCEVPGDNLPDPGVQNGVGIKTGCVTVISLASFEAVAGNKKVSLQWKTESETNNAGFNIYRAESENGEYVKINEVLIPAEGSATGSASYTFTDTTAKNGRTYYYTLEDIDLNGTATTHGPESATPRWFYAIWK